MLLAVIGIAYNSRATLSVKLLGRFSRRVNFLASSAKKADAEVPYRLLPSSLNLALKLLVVQHHVVRLDKDIQKPQESVTHVPMLQLLTPKKKSYLRTLVVKY